MTANENEMPTVLFGEPSALVYNPAADRNLHMQFVGPEKLLRDVKAGDEILDNYLAMVGHETDWKGDVLHIRAQCNGEGVGDVTEYEERRSAE
jgi:hypothetical protein